MPDFAALVSVEGAGEFVFHIEFELAYRERMPERMARYGMSLAWQYMLPVQSVLVLLRRDQTLGEIPVVGEYAIGETRTTHPYRVVKLWEVDPTPLLESEDRTMLPWVVLMNSSDEQVRELAAEIGASGSEELLGKFLALGSIRYDRERLKEMTGGDMGIVEAILQESSIVRHLVDEAAEQAGSQGRTEGRAEGARNSLRASLATKFPGLESMPELDMIADMNVLQSLLVEYVLGCGDRARTEQAIRSAARGQ